MGANTSQLAISDPTKQPHTTQIDQTTQCRIYHNKNGQQYQKYRVNNYGAMDFISKYQYRIKSPHPHLVKAYFIEQVGSTFICANKNLYYHVVIERIPHRLSDFVKLGSQDGINILKGALQGYSQIYNTIGLILVKDNMIGINKQNQVKVWINPRFHLNNLQPQPTAYQQLHKNQKQQTMIQNIYEIINSKVKVKRQRLWEVFSEQWDRIEPKKFQRCLEFIQNFIVVNKIPMRGFQAIQSKSSQKEGEERLFLNRKTDKSSTRKLQGFKDQSQYLFTSQSPRFSEHFNDLTPRSNQSSLQKSLKVNSYTIGNCSTAFRDEKNNATTMRSSFAGVRARIIHLPQQDNGRQIVHHPPMQFSNNISHKNSEVKYYQFQTPKNNNAFINYQYWNNNLTPQNKPTPFYPTTPIATMNFVQNSNIVQYNQPIHMSKVNKTFSIPQISYKKQTETNVHFNYRNTNLFHNSQDNNRQNFQDNKKIIDNNKQKLNVNQNKVEKINEIQTNNKNNTIGSQIKKIIHSKNSISKKIEIRHSQNINHLITSQKQRKEISNQAILKKQSIQKIQNTNQNRVPGRIKHKFSQLVKNQSSNSINVRNGEKNIQLIKKQIINIQNKNQQREEQKLQKICINPQIIKEQKIDKTNKIKQQSPEKLKKEINQNNSQKYPYININIKQIQQKQQLQPIKNPQQIVQNKKQKEIYQQQNSLKYKNPFNIQLQKSNKYSRLGITQRLNKLILQNSLNKSKRLKTEQNQTNSLCSKFKNQIKMDFSRASIANSETSGSVSYKDLRNLLKSIKKKNS